MTRHGFTESIVEEAALAWLEAVGGWNGHITCLRYRHPGLLPEEGEKLFGGDAPSEATDEPCLRICMRNCCA